MSGITLSTQDVLHHTIKFGLDVYPAIEAPAERTRLNMFYETIYEKWPEIYEQLTAGDREFKITKRFRQTNSQGPALPVDTFVLTQRGPIFSFPLRLPDPLGETGLEKIYRERFNEVSEQLWSAVPGRKVLRIGLVREVVFSTGNQDCNNFVSERTEWKQARLVGGSRLIHYRDSQCNIRLEIRPCEIMKRTQLPIGSRVDERVGYGLQLRLDVNNVEPKPLEKSDIESVIDRAVGLWSEDTLEYLKGE